MTDLTREEIDEEWDDELYCTHCGGDADVWGSEIETDYGMYAPNALYPCPSCQGTGLRSKQVIF
jgi:hypothetical protein